jgi:hypothetical protein
LDDFPARLCSHSNLKYLRRSSTRRRRSHYPTSLIMPPKVSLARRSACHAQADAAVQKEKSETKTAAPSWTPEATALLVTAVADNALANRKILFDTPGLESQ